MQPHSPQHTCPAAVSQQLSPHCSRPASVQETQPPLTQKGSVPPQTVPQAPQLAASEFVSTHTPPQTVPAQPQAPLMQ
jgi:hypothetical protein